MTALVREVIFFFNKHCVEVVLIPSFFWAANLRIQLKYGKTGTRKNSVLGHFSHSEEVKILRVDSFCQRVSNCGLP